MLINETGDIINYPIFCQQVNCKGVMGAGLAKYIRNKYPEVYSEYRKVCSEGKAILGVDHYTYLNDRICVCMFAQDGYGRDKRYTDYQAFRTCLNGLELFLKSRKEKVIAFPYMIGCGLAGGDWYIVQGMLKDFSKKVKQDVIIVNKE